MYSLCACLSIQAYPSLGDTALPPPENTPNDVWEGGMKEFWRDSGKSHTTEKQGQCCTFRNCTGSTLNPAAEYCRLFTFWPIHSLVLAIVSLCGGRLYATRIKRSAPSQARRRCLSETQRLRCNGDISSNIIYCTLQ